MAQTIRPNHIGDVFDKIYSTIDTDSYTKFEAYVADLEANQLVRADSPSSTWDYDNPPIWSHKRRMERVKQRHQRKLNKTQNRHGQ